MTLTSRLMMAAVAVGLAACARPAPPPAVPAGPSPASAASPASTPVQSTEVTGHWTGDWGDLYLRAEPDGTVRGIYSHDDGAVVGRVRDGVFKGWWCEAPSRAADEDAGDVEFVFGRDGAGLFLDGRWRYGATNPDWRQDWDLRWTDAPVDPGLLAGFDQAARFCPHP